MAGLNVLTPVDGALLDALATYRLLTIKQAEHLGIGNRWHLGDRLKILETARLVKILTRARMTGPNLHWLTARGAQLVEELAADTGTPRKVGVRRMDYKLGPQLRQRELTVDCHIALRQWAGRNGAKVEWVRTEFDPTEQHLTKATALEWKGMAYEADALINLETADGEHWLLCLEVETGGEAESLDNFTRRLPARLDALTHHVPEMALRWPDGRRAARLLFVFRSETMFERAKLLVRGETAPAWKRVYLKSAPALLEDFGSPWWRVGYDPASPFVAA